MNGVQTHEEIGAEARRVVAGATERGETVRIAGGVAFQLRVAGRLSLPRPPLGDIDLVAPGKRERRVAAALTELGYTGEKEFNARHGDRRMIFWDQARDRKLEVFVGRFVMCHELPLTERLSLEAETIPLAELLLTKLQIVELNEKDVRDTVLLFHGHDVSDHDDDTVNAARIAELCGNDWGLWRTITANLGRCREHLSNYELPAPDRERIDQRLDTVLERIEEAPKSRGWKLRAKIGERKRWYELPEEVEQ